VLAYQAQARCLHARFSRLTQGSVLFARLQDKERKGGVIGREKDKKKDAVLCTLYSILHNVVYFTSIVPCCFRVLQMREF
jgi:hypothetical protein